jgi:hypothetical protein
MHSVGNEATEPSLLVNRIWNRLFRIFETKKSIIEP